MGCVLKTSTLYKDMVRIHGNDYTVDAYAMAYKLDDLMNLGVITTSKFVQLSNDQQIVYTVPKYEGRDSKSEGWKKEQYLRKKLETELVKRDMVTVRLRETPKSILVIVKPERVLTDAEYSEIEALPPIPKQEKIEYFFKEDYIQNLDALREQEEEYPMTYDEIKLDNKRELKTVGAELDYINDVFTPEESEIYNNFEKYYPEENEYFSDWDKKKFVKLLAKGAIQTKCKL